MALTPGTRLGAYDVIARIGEGGMGQVWRARDTTLNRDVALKVLPDAFAGDADRLARFTREAQTLAALNHPNIAQIYGLEGQAGPGASGAQPIALVMELVEGEDLSQRIARGAIPLDEALPIAKQIAEALEAAHEQGIIHRDLKPANIKVRPDGTVKVLDFGLAKGLRPEAGRAGGVGGEHLSQSPTITSPALLTGVGVILGTAAYMPPEQAKGREADKRSDIWAFGCVLYEMLTGRRAFDGDDVTDTLAAVLRAEPHWQALPGDVPHAIQTLLRKCLTKDRRARAGDIAVALFAMDQARLIRDDVASAEVPVRGWTGRSAVTHAAVALVAAVSVGVAAWAVVTRGREPLRARVSRFELARAGAGAVSLVGGDLAITPDGSRIAYVGNNGSQLLVRAVDSLEPTAVFTGGPTNPFVSPDGQWIGFADRNVLLKKVATTGGPPLTLTPLDGNLRGATWGADGSAIFATNNATTGLQRIAAVGGLTAVLTRPDRALGEADHLFPEMLPGGRAVLFTIAALTGGLQAAQVAVLDLETGRRKVLVRGGSHARYIPRVARALTRVESAGGYLIYGVAGTLRAIPFDLAGLEIRGTPLPVATDIVTMAYGLVDAAVSEDGTLAYVAGSASYHPSRTMVWVDRQGRETPIAAPARPYLYPRLSPDGNRIAVWASDQESDVWVWDLARATLTRATFDPANDTYPMWSADGRRLIFGSIRAGVRNMFWQAADGTGSVERLAESAKQQTPTGVSPDGRQLVFHELTSNGAEDLMRMTLDDSHHVTPLLQSPAAERNGVVSPDGRWLAYEADDSGQFEISVRPYPAVASGHWQVSTTGGTRPLWSRDGHELFFVSPTGAIMRSGVEVGASWASTAPTEVVKQGYVTAPGNDPGRTFDVSADGRQFLVVKEDDADGAPNRSRIIVVQHFDEELERLVPTR